MESTFMRFHLKGTKAFDFIPPNFSIPGAEDLAKALKAITERYNRAMTLASPAPCATENLCHFLELPDAGLELFEEPTFDNTFALFRKLPQELRDKIWITCLPYKRTIHVKAKRELSYEKGVIFGSCTPPPITFRICHESRKATKALFKVLLGGKDNKPVTYVCYDRDVVSFSGESFEPTDCGDIFDSCYSAYGNNICEISPTLGKRLKKIQYLEIKEMSWTREDSRFLQMSVLKFDHLDEVNTRHIGLFFGHLPKLKEVTLVTSNRNEAAGLLVNEQYQEECLSVLQKFFEAKASENRASENKASENKASEDKARFAKMDSKYKADEDKADEDKGGENKGGENKGVENKGGEDESDKDEDEDFKVPKFKLCVTRRAERGRQDPLYQWIY
ncbi:hypothetical protein EG329_002521 [Mollisiaceae sp. DMI_Dod_QoI]|nr:hypothetical protein EG329_002521 [Helotiales sp. DMI_Dod_QoI]